MQLHTFEFSFKFREIFNNLMAPKKQKHIHESFKFHLWVFETGTGFSGSTWFDKKDCFEAFSNLKTKKHVFEAFWNLQHRNRVFKSVFTLKNKKARFWSVFQVYKMKKHVLEAFAYLQNEKTRFWSVFIFTK